MKPVPICLESQKTTDPMIIHNMLYEHRKNVCRLMAIEPMNQLKRNKLYNYVEYLQTRLNDMSKNISFEVKYIEEPIAENNNLTIGEWLTLQCAKETDVR